MTFLLAATLLLSLIYLSLHFYMRRPGAITVADFFVFFVLFQLGPVALLLEPLFGITAFPVSREILERHHVGIIIMYATLIPAMAVGRAVFAKRGTGQTVSYGIDARTYSVAAILVVILLAVLVTDPAVWIKVKTIFRFVSGQDIGLSYNELRRDIFNKPPFLIEVVGRMRYSVMAGLFCSLIAFSLYMRRRRFWTAALALALIVFGVSSFSKLPYLWYVVYVILLVYFVRHEQGLAFGLGRHKRIIVIGLPLGLALLMALYSFQYQADLSDLVETATYRLFAANIDVLKLYFLHYPPVKQLDGASSSLIAAVFGLDYQNPAEFIPNHIYGRAYTSWPTAFIGAAYADFGFVGIAAMSVLVALFVEFLSAYAMTFRSPVLRIAYLAVCGLNTGWLVQNAAPTALLTGGLAVFPVLFWLLEKSGRLIIWPAYRDERRL